MARAQVLSDANTSFEEVVTNFGAMRVLAGSSELDVS
jgi:hypothetical protein